MKKKLIVTRDGSHSFFVPDLEEVYHSRHGAINEAKHVFIKNGVCCSSKKNIRILEIGFGTGLNALLTKLHADKNKIQIFYNALELFPLEKKEYCKLNFTKKIGVEKKELLNLHKAPFEKRIRMSDYFILLKNHQDVLNFTATEQFDIIYFDAFAPDKQPELWGKKIFFRMYESLKRNGCIVTYCAKGIIKRRLKLIGFDIEVLVGPPGKKEMIRANKR